MANPQKENGYTQIATEILEALAKKQVPLSDHEWKILMFLFRKTYGWKKTSEQISLSQFAEGTGTHRNHISRAIQKLIKKNLVRATQMGATQNKKYSFQKDYEKWQGAPNLVAEEGAPKQVSKGAPDQDQRGTKIIQKAAPKQVPTIDTTKETNKRNIKESENEVNLEMILATMDSDIKNFKSIGNSTEWIKNLYTNLGVPEAQIDKALSKIF